MCAGRMCWTRLWSGPGRFDRIIYVGAPDFEGRIEVLKVCARGAGRQCHLCVSCLQRPMHYALFTKQNERPLLQCLCCLAVHCLPLVSCKLL